MKLVSGEKKYTKKGKCDTKKKWRKKKWFRVMMAVTILKYSTPYKFNQVTIYGVISLPNYLHIYLHTRWDIK